MTTARSVIYLYIDILIMSAPWTGFEVSKKKKGSRNFSSVVSVQEAGWWSPEMLGWPWKKISQPTWTQRWKENKGNVVLECQS